MNELDMLDGKNREMVHEFSSRCIGRIEDHVPLKAFLAPFYRFLEANVEKEADKDRLIIECAVAAHYEGTDPRAVSREELFEKTKHVDAAFLKKVSLPLLSDVPYQYFADIRKKRIDVLFGTVCDLMKNWKEHHSFSETVRKTYSPEQFRKIIIDILQLYTQETMMVAASIKLPFPARIVKDRIEPRLYAIMELVAEEIAGEYTEKTLSG
jgi:hypothetical protein